MVSEWGGMTFLLPYVLFVILIASTGVIEEMALGRAAKSGPIKAFGKCTEIRTGNKRTGEVIGVIPVIGSLALAIGYSVVVGWIFKYTFFALSGGLFHLRQDVAAIEGLFGGTAAAFGNNVWQVVAMLVTAVIMAYGISGGIEKANKIMMPMLFILFVGSAYIFLHFQVRNMDIVIFLHWSPKGFLIQDSGSTRSARHSFRFPSQEMEQSFTVLI